MAKKKTADAAAEATKRESQYTPDEQRAYVEAVIRKQCGLDAAAAAKRADELLPEEFVLLHDAGRDGQVAVCREILGLE
jgi:hypothetical protein